MVGLRVHKRNSLTSSLYFINIIQWRIVVKPGWDITFSRMTNAWEVSRVISFFNLLGTFGCLQEGVD
ncbi:hypothetical protein H5410_062068 [Solanum commersonii]|uniref:Uncharacterized protein n=1 Tax=Solanum commersonii TaxID=4109 RepID=A0A9J5WBI5_SOLCO|nr:hypothetical protein H5410_062068 [Solanum commersonii]